MFESVLIEIINKFLGPYVKNLNASQIKLSVWSGDVRLDNLELKENALEQFNLPIKTHFGYLKKFRAVIPWKNLYNDPTIIEIEGLYVNAGPNSAFKYDPQKALEEEVNKKLQELEKIRKFRKNKKAKKDQNEEEGQDLTFIEKVATQVIKNLQVTIKDIHIRYEDTHTLPGQTFSAGITLSSLILHSTDSNYKIGGSSNVASSLIFKVVDLKGLSVYWNTSATSYSLSSLKQTHLIDLMNKDIIEAGATPRHLNYILMPVQANAKLQLDTKAGRNLSIPQALVNLEINDVTVTLAKPQYRQALYLLEEFDRMKRNKPYYKFRPEAPIKSNAKKWWKYAFNSVMNDIGPKLHENSWKHIKSHRDKCKRYVNKYTQKLLSSTSNPERSKTISQLELELDVFNILLCREIAEQKVAKIRKQKVAKQKESKSSWGSWFGFGKSKSEQDDVTILNQIKVGSPVQLEEEKKKFYNAIGYNEEDSTNVLTSYPKDYVAHKFYLTVRKINVVLRNEKDSIATLASDSLLVNVQFRPSARGIAFQTEFSELKLSGQRFETYRPLLLRNVTTVTSPGRTTPVFSLHFEKNPVNSQLDYAINASLQPLEVVYDAVTLDSILAMFIIPPNIHLFNLQNFALETVNDMRTLSTTGLKFAIENRTLIDIKVDIKSPYIIIPEDGVYKPDIKRLIILDLGYLYISSDMQQALNLDISSATQDQLELAFYDRFNVRLEKLQILLATPGQDWDTCRISSNDSTLHIVKPTGFELHVSKSLLPNDTRLPSLKVNGSIKSIEFNLSEQKIQNLTETIMSLPLPPPSLVNHATQVVTMRPIIPHFDEFVNNDEYEKMLDTLNADVIDNKLGRSSSSDSSLFEYEFNDDTDSTMTVSTSTDSETDSLFTSDDSSSAPLPTHTKILIDFSVETIGVIISKQKGEIEVEILSLILSNGSFQLKKRTWDMIFNATLGQLQLIDLTPHKISDEGRGHFSILTNDNQDRVIAIELCIAERESPEYTTLFNSTHKTVRVTTYPIHFHLRKDTIYEIASLFVSLVPSLGKAKSSQLAIQAKSSIERFDEAVEGNLGYKPSFWGRENEQGLRIDIVMHPTSLTLHEDDKPYIRAQFLGIQSCAVFKRLRMDLTLTIQGYLIEDLNTDSLYTTLLSKVDHSAPFLSLKINVFKEATKGKKYLDLEQNDLYIEVTIGEMRVVLLAPLIAKVLPYFTQLASLDFQDNVLLDSAKDAATATINQTAVIAKESKNNRLKFNVTVQAPSIVIPLSAISPNVFLIKLGDLMINNEFKFASDVYGRGTSSEVDKWTRPDGMPIIVDKMQMTFNDLEIQQCSNFNPTDPGTSEKLTILDPVNFEFILNRILYDLNDSEIPTLNSSAKIDSITLHIRPCDLVNLAQVIKNLTILGAAIDVSNNRNKVKQNRINVSPTISPKKDGKLKKLSDTSNFFMITANLNTVRVVIYSYAEGFAVISVNQMSIKTCIKSKETIAEASINSFKIVDLTPGSIYSNILTTPTSDSNVIEIGVKLFNDATKGDKFFDINQHDIAVKLSLGKVKFNIVYSFISKVIATFIQIKISRSTLNTITAKAKKQAAVTASSTVEKISEKQTKRLLLSISFEAPLIVIPSSLDSYQSLVIDLGLITAQNSFSLDKPFLTDCPDYKFPLHIADQSLIFDFIEFKISSIQLYRMTINNERAPPILNSFELKVSIVRTLPFNVAEKAQTILVLNLSPIAMVFSLEDYSTMMNILNKNFLQGSKLEKPISEDEDKLTIDSIGDTSEHDTPKQRTFPFISVYFNMEEYSLTLSANQQNLTTLTISGARAEFYSVEKSLNFIGQLKDLSLRDSSTDTLYPKIVTLDPSLENVISFNISYYLHHTEEIAQLSYTNIIYDLEFNLNVGQIDIYILNSYISKLVNFATQFSPPKRKQPEIAEKVTDLQENTGVEARLNNLLQTIDEFAKLKQRFRIEINFKAPRIIIPKNRTSTHVLIADLGHLTVKSTPILKSITSPLNSLPTDILYDNIQPVLSNFKLSRAYLLHDANTDTLIPTVIRPLITKFSLEMSIQRRLTVNCSAPFLLITLHLTDMSLLIGSKDIQMILDTIIEQSEERDKTITPKKKHLQSENYTPTDSPVKKIQADQIPQKAKHTLKRQHSYFSDPSVPLFQANIQIDSVGIKLYYKDKDIQEEQLSSSSPEIQPISEEKCLTRLAIVGTSLQFSLNPNLETDLTFDINDIILHDLRIERRNMINQMLSRSILSKSPNVNSLLNFKLKREIDGDLTVVIKVTNMTLLVSPEFIITLILYFGEHFERMQQLKVEQKRDSISPRRRSVTILSRPEGVTKKDKTKSKRNLESYLPVIRIIINIRNPTILFLEDASDSNSRSLVSNVEVSGIFKVDENRNTTSTISITSAKLYTCHYNKINQPYSNVLEPVNINISVTGLAKDISVHSDKIIINISPTTIALLSNIAQSFQFPNENDLGYAPVDLWEAGSIKLHEWFVEPTQSLIESSLLSTGSISSSDSSLSSLEPLSVSEMLELDISSIDIKLESEYSGMITPMLLLHSSMLVTVSNWSRALEMEALLNVEASYYNIKLSTWEPLIEPSLLLRQDKLIPFRLKTNFYLKDRKLKKNVVKIAEDDSQSQALLADSTLEVTGVDGLNVTVTREFIELLYKFVQEVTKGRKISIATNSLLLPTERLDNTPKDSPYLIENVLGVTVTVELRADDKLFFDYGTKATKFELANHSKQNVFSSVSLYDLSQAILSKQASFTEHYISLTVNGFSYKLPSIPISKTGNFLYALRTQVVESRNYYLVIDISIRNKQKCVLIRSPMRICNKMVLNIELYSLLISSPQPTPTSIAVIKPCETYYVSLGHSHQNSFMLAPYQLGYSPANFAFNLNSKFYSTNIECHHSNTNESSFYITVDITEEEFAREPTSLENQAVNIPHHIINLHFTCILQNLLPIELSYEVDVTLFRSTVKPGKSSNVLFAKIGRDSVIHLSLVIFGQTLTGNLALRHNDGISECTIKNVDSPYKVRMSLGIFTEIAGSLLIKVYAPYCIINKTGLSIDYISNESGIESHIEHDPALNPLIFPSTSLKSKVQLSLRYRSKEDKFTEWSKSLTIGAVGSENLVQTSFAATQVTYEFGLKITSSNLSLTKFVVITPYNLLINNTKQQITINPNSTDSVTLETGDCTPFYPQESNIRVKPITAVSSALLDIKNTEHALLRLDGVNSAIAVDIIANISSNVITFQSYYKGAVPVQIVNTLANTPIFIRQKDTIEADNSYILPRTFLNYSWKDYSKPKVLEWRPTETFLIASSNLAYDDSGQVEYPYGLNENGGVPVTNTPSSTEEHSDFVDLSLDTTNEKGSKIHLIYWVSFMDGLQRKLLITDNKWIARQARQVKKKERILFNFSFSLAQLGVSLVDSITRTEISYITLMSSDPVWQYLLNNRLWKTLTGDKIKRLEEAYKINPNGSIVQKDLTANFEAMEISAPVSGILRRTYFAGVSTEIQISSAQVYIDVKVASIQVDNQMSNVLYPIVFNSVTAPAEGLNFEAKPFLEASLILLINKLSTAKSLNIRYFKVLIQEMSFNLDIGFVEGLLGLFLDLEEREWTTEELFKLDYKQIVDASISELEGSATASQGTKHYIDYLHFSPLKINLSFSLHHGSEVVDRRARRKVVTTKGFRILLDSLGVPGSANDVLLKLRYLEIKHRAVTQRQLISSFIKHYKQAGLAQIYKILLGFDVLGNPIALIRGLGTGAKDLFYEPYQGAIEGPEAFLLGLGSGITSLAGHTVGGVAGTVSKITGTLGKGLAALTFDTKYQRRRRKEDLKATTANEELYRGGKSFALGIFEGVTGVVCQPVKGAVEEGAFGLVKGLGKGIIGVVARPLGGGVDLATATFESIQKAVSSDKVLVKKRYPRFIGLDKIVKIYNPETATANAILVGLLSNKTQAYVEAYMSHLFINDTSGSTIIYIVTNKHLLKAERKSLLDPLNPWKQIEEYSLDSISSSDWGNEGVTIHLAKEQKGFFGLGSAKNRLLLNTSEIKKAQYFSEQLNQLLESYNYAF